MNCCLSGSQGFIGSHLLGHLLGAGHKVVGYDLQSGEDIRNEFQLDRVFNENQFDMVIHLAALAGVPKSIEYPKEYIDTNVTGTHNIVEMCQKYGVKNLISFSSSSVLGTQSGGRVSERAPCNPISLYGITKLAGEQIVRNSGLNYFIIRPFSVYGMFGRHDMVIYRWIEQIKAGKPITFYGDGGSERGYTYVEDLCKAVVRLTGEMEAVESPREDMTYDAGRIIHLGGSEVITLNMLYAEFERYCKKKVWSKYFLNQ